MNNNESASPQLGLSEAENPGAENEYTNDLVRILPIASLKFTHVNPRNKHNKRIINL